MRTLTGGLALAAAMSLTACATTPTGSPATPTHQGATQSAAPAPTPTVPTTSPLSGRPGGVDTPVMIVKIDNTTAAQPHTGIPAADIVYVEPVEWGLTRLAAVFSTKIPKVVGPVRSARVTDIQAFAPYGSVAFVFSGAQRKLWPHLQSSPFTLLADDIDGTGFYRERTRRAPVNLMAVPKALFKEAGKVARSKDMGLVFDAVQPFGGKDLRAVKATWPYSTVAFKWSAKAGKFNVWMDGRPAVDTIKPFVEQASTVVVQYVKEVDSGYGDKFGGRTPLAKTIGRGKGWILRGGQSFPMRWSRASKGAPTLYTDVAGQPIPFDPGQVWVLLLDKKRPVKFTR